MHAKSRSEHKESKSTLGLKEVLLARTDMRRNTKPIEKSSAGVEAKRRSFFFHELVSGLYVDARRFLRCESSPITPASCICNRMSIYAARASFVNGNGECLPSDGVTVPEVEESVIEPPSVYESSAESDTTELGGGLVYSSAMESVL